MRGIYSQHVQTKETVQIVSVHPPHTLLPQTHHHGQRQYMESVLPVLIAVGLFSQMIDLHHILYVSI